MTEPTVEFTISDLAYILGVTRGTVYNMQNRNEVPDGSGIDVVKTYLKNEDARLDGIRARLSEKVAERLVIGV